MKIGVMGAGAWGTALALALVRGGNEVLLHGRDEAQMAAMAATRRNRRYLGDIELPSAISPTARASALLDRPILLAVVPAQSLRQALADLSDFEGQLVLCAKGIEHDTGKTLGEVAREACPRAEIAALSGPSFAIEVARGLPSALTLAAGTAAKARELALALAAPGFRLYPSDDLVGVEIGGALKNVIAIAAGVVSGRELGENARAAVITRGLAELTRLGLACGARRETLMGLSGLGDLILTATSLTSRNTRFGHELGRGVPLAALMAPGGALREGALTAAAAVRLGETHGLELPIAAAVAAVVEERWTVDEAIERLLARPLPETE